MLCARGLFDADVSRRAAVRFVAAEGRNGGVGNVSVRVSATPVAAAVLPLLLLPPPECTCAVSSGTTYPYPLSRMRLTLRALDLASRRGGALRELATRVDAVRGLGLRGALQRVRAERELAAHGDEPWDAVYLRIWSDAAAELGASVHELGSGFLELRRGGAVTRVRQQFTELDGPVALQLALDRRVVFGLLEEAGVPIPEHLELDPSQADVAIPFLNGGPCVVKPAAGTGVGSGITSGIQVRNS